MEPSPAVLLLDLPPAALAGIDLLSFTTTAQFRGIKGLPAGPHFVFTAPHATLAVRHGAWLYIHKTVTTPQLVVKKWDSSAETLVAERDSAALLAQAANLGAIWRTGLSPYRQHAGESLTAEPSESAWSILASQISAPYLARVFGSDDPAAWHASSYSDVVTQTDGLQPSFDTDPPLRFLAVDLRRPWPAGATGQERTRAALDYSWYLSDIGTQNALPGSDEDIILTEMQFTFLLALTLNNMSALEQWRTLLRLTLGCRTAPQSHPAFFVAALDLLAAQLSRLGNQSSDQPSSTATAPTSSAKPLEARSEAELLAYDLPIRYSSRQNNSSTRQTASDQVKPSLSADPDLTSLFLDTDSDPSDPFTSNRSFLHTLLRSFANPDLPSDLRRALSRVEALLFDLFGWTFDADDNDADDDGEAEGGDYAPAVVELSQAQMDELGIEGTVVGDDAGGKEGREKREEVMKSRTVLREGGVSRVVVESDEEEEIEAEEEEEDWDDTVDIEDLDARY